MPSPGFQARPAFPDHSRTLPWPATRPHETDNRPPRTFPVPLCLFTHDTKLQCNIFKIVPGTPKKIAINSSQFPNGRIVGRCQTILSQWNDCCIKFRTCIFRHSTPGMRKRTFESPLAKACQAPVAERLVALPPGLTGSESCRNHISSIRHFRTSSDRVVPNAVRQCGYRTLHPTNPRATGARSSARRAIIQSRSLSSTTTSEPVASRAARMEPGRQID